MKYNRILLKLSGESLMGKQSYGIAPEMLEQYAKDIKAVVEKGVEVAIVIGGGNIFRGLSGASKGMDRVQGDYMGMLATLINSMALQAELEKQGMKTELLGGLAIEPICKEMSRRRAIEAMQEGRVVVRRRSIYSRPREGPHRNQVCFPHIPRGPRQETENYGFDCLCSLRGEQSTHLCVRHEQAWQSAKSGHRRTHWHRSNKRLIIQI